MMELLGFATKLKPLSKLDNVTEKTETWKIDTNTELKLCCLEFSLLSKIKQ